LAKPKNDGIAVCMICLLDPVHAPAALVVR